MNMRGSGKRREAGLLLLCWVILLALTFASYRFAETGGSGPRAATATLVLGIAAIKAHLIGALYMELIHAPRVWAIGMSAYLLLLSGSLIWLFS